MTDKELRAAILARTRNGRVACKALLTFARESGTAPRRIGRLCDAMKVRISACQLGCFR